MAFMHSGTFSVTDQALIWPRSSWTRSMLQSASIGKIHGVVCFSLQDPWWSLLQYARSMVKFASVCKVHVAVCFSRQGPCCCLLQSARSMVQSASVCKIHSLVCFNLGCYLLLSQDLFIRALHSFGSWVLLYSSVTHFWPDHRLFFWVKNTAVCNCDDRYNIAGYLAPLLLRWGCKDV